MGTRPATELVMLTQNALGVGPGWPWRRRLLARRIAALGPDVVGLQEVRHAASPASQAHELAGLVGGFEVVTAPGHPGPEGGREGVALLCRRPILGARAEHLTLPDEDPSSGRGRRAVLRATIEAPGGTLDAYVTHLPRSRRAKVRMVAELLAFVGSELLATGSRAAVLMGDFNAAPDEPSIRSIAEAGWRDAWTAIHGDRARGGTWPAPAPVQRLDYIFARLAPGWAIVSCIREPLSGSDHRGVAAVLRADVG